MKLFKVKLFLGIVCVCGLEKIPREIHIPIRFRRFLGEMLLPERVHRRKEVVLVLPVKPSKRLVLAVVYGPRPAGRDDIAYRSERAFIRGGGFQTYFQNRPCPVNVLKRLHVLEIAVLPETFLERPGFCDKLRQTIL